MNRRDFLQQTLWAHLAGGLPRPIAGAAPRRPNFLLILIDDLGWADLGCYRSTFHESPHLDRFARTGVRFTNAYSAGTVCSPTRAGIMTGKYPVRTGVTDYIPGLRVPNTRLLPPENLHQLALDEVTIAEALKEAGYGTWYVGKWHLGDRGYSPLEQGFETNVDRQSLGFVGSDYYKPVPGKEPEYLTDRLTDESIRLMESAGDRPFLLYLSYHTVHTPIQACRRHIEKFRKKLAALPPGPAPARERRGLTRLRQDNPDYASMVFAMDERPG